MEIISILDVVRKDIEDNIYNFTKDGKCSQCGACCSRILPLSDKEIREIHRYIKKHNIKECKHFLPVSNEQLDLTCPFLDNSKKSEKCRIYEVRPLICRKFCCDNSKRAKHDRDLYRQTRKVVDMKEEFFGGSQE